MKGIFSVLCMTLFFSAASAAFAGSAIHINPPTVDATNQTAVNQGCAAIESKLNTDEYFSKLGNLKDLTRGFANANAACFDNGSMVGFQNYDIFCVMLGMNLGMAFDGTSDYQSAIRDTGDAYVGTAVGAPVINAGLNCSFLVPNLYLSGKFGYYSRTFGDLGIDIATVGVGANYSLFSTYDILYGLFKWRGISVGTGLVYNYNSISFTGDGFSGNTSTFSGVTTTVDDVTAKFKLTSSALVIPAEISSSVQFLWLFNIGGGLGCDIVIPSSKVSASGQGSVNVSGNGATVSKPGSISLTGVGTTSSPKFFDVFSPRVSMNIGLNISAIKIDMPFSYYPMTSAYALGFSVGAWW